MSQERKGNEKKGKDKLSYIGSIVSKEKQEKNVNWARKQIMPLKSNRAYACV